METANQIQTQTANATATATVAAPPATELPARPAALAIDFDGPELTQQLEDTSRQIAALENETIFTRKLREALLLDPSFTGDSNSARRSPTTGSDLTSAADLLVFWENGLIYTDNHPPVTIESLQFNPNAAGKLFNMHASQRFVLETTVIVAIERALNAGWRGETQESINRQLAAARERLELLKAKIPKASVRASVEAYVRGVDAALVARVETVQAPLADLESFITTACTTIDLSFLSSIEGVEAELDAVGRIAKRWMIKAVPTDKPPCRVRADLNTIGERLASVAKQLLAASERIDSRRKLLRK